MSFKIAKPIVKLQDIIVTIKAVRNVSGTGGCGWISFILTESLLPGWITEWTSAEGPEGSGGLIVRISVKVTAGKSQSLF